MSDKKGLDRRALLGAAVLGAGAFAAATSKAEAEVLFPKEPRSFGAGGSATGAVHRSEGDIYDCEVEGDLPDDLDGAFYRVGPDPQYPKEEKYKNDIVFDGEGHVSMFRIKGGHVDYRSRYVRTQRWKAQHAARKSLWGMYRNPTTDDPSVKGLSAGTANTQLVFHHGKLMALKEDSPPVVIHPLTLETLDDYYTFGGGLQGQTFTAHPKIDPFTGDMIAFGFEAKGFYTPDVEVLSVDKTGKVNWRAWVKSPYVCMLHDFAVTQNHIAFLTCPLASNPEQIAKGGVHWAWDSSLPTWLGVMRRGGDGKDIRWYKGPNWMAIHTMGAFSDGEKLYFDVDGAPANQLPFFPSVHKDPPPGPGSFGRVVRMSVDTSKKKVEAYEMKDLFPGVTGALSRQDDRYHTVPYRYGYLGGRGWQMVDHQTGKFSTFTQPDTRLQEMTFVPRKKDAPEGDGYLIGIGNRSKENGRSDLFIVDTQDLSQPRAVVKMPYRIVDQVHGYWVGSDQLPAA
jgi:carotenoid cleavage dioxygenase-like enzyme